MSLSANGREELREYLLGQLAGDRRELVEKAFMTDDGLFEELEIAECDLIDDYLARELTPEQRQRFEQFFLIIPERYSMLGFARALGRYTSVSQVSSGIDLTWTRQIRIAWNSQTRIFRAAAVAAALIIIANAFWLIPPRLNPRRTFATYALKISTGTRAEGTQATKVKLPLLVDRLKLQLRLPGPSSPLARYRVELLNENGETKTLETVSQNEDAVVVEMSSSQISRGEYALKVFVIKPDGSEQCVRGSYLLSVE